MDVAHVDIVKEKLGEKALEALRALYQVAKGSPPSVPVERFRADNYQWLDVLDKLEHNHSLLERSDDHKSYILRSYALPLVAEAAPVLDKMQCLFERMRELYPVHLSQSIDLSVLLEGVEGERSEWLDALYYLTETSGVWSGKSNDFPYDDGSTMVISESVLRKDSAAGLLSQFYEWHYVNPTRTATSWTLGSEGSEFNTVFFADESKGGFPAWYDELDDIKKSLISEIDIALKSKLSALPMIGLRTLLDVVMVEKVGDYGRFNKTLEEFQKAGYTTSREVELLDVVLDAGNASAHRAYMPNEEDLLVCIDVVKHLMEGVYILQPKIKEVKGNTPPRKKPKK